MVSLYGRKLSGVRFAKLIRESTTPRSVGGWANAGRRCRMRNGLRILQKLTDCVNCRFKNIQITSTGTDAKGREPAEIL